MRIGILGRKVGMTQVFDEKGSLIPITVIDTTGCVVSQVKTQDKDGYTAVQLAFGEVKPQNVKKAKAGHFKKASSKAKQYIEEIRLADNDDVAPIKLGTELSVSMFQKGDKVDVTGTSKGRGFAGVIKRFGFHGKDATHGTHEYFRHPGSAGTNTFPGRIMKNKGMPGHMGDVRATVQGLKVIDVKPEENLLFVEGGVPGSRSSKVLIRLAIKSKSKEGRSIVAASDN
jgi:large subunit ribosomal protein L3